MNTHHPSTSPALSAPISALKSKSSKSKSSSERASWIPLKTLKPKKLFKPQKSSGSSRALIGSLFASVLLLTACSGNHSDPDSDQSATAQNSQEGSHETVSLDHGIPQAMFAGCYTVSHDEPAQIKISYGSYQLGKPASTTSNNSDNLAPDNKKEAASVTGWYMQMKEPASAKRIWDDPEPLEVLDNAQTSTYFSIDPEQVEAMLARPDRFMVIAHVTPTYVNIDPLLDSEYLAYIYRGANTIYKVECDEVNLDLVSNPN